MAATFLFERDGWEYFVDYVGGGTPENGAYITQTNNNPDSGAYGSSYGNVNIYFKRQVSVNSTTRIATIDYFIGYSIPSIMNNRSWSVTAVGLDDVVTYSSQKVSGTGNTSINPGFVYEYWEDPNDSSNVYTPYMLQSRHIITAPVTANGVAKVSIRPNFYYQHPVINSDGSYTTGTATYTFYYTDEIEGLASSEPPTITSVTFTDQNTAVTNYMGQGIYLKYASKIQYDVSYTVDASVELKYVRVICGDQILLGASGVIENPSTGTISVQVVDSNSQAAEQTYYLTIKDYIQPTITISCTEPNALGETTATVSGECYNDGNTNSWGDLNNTLAVRCAYRQSGDEEWTWIDAKLSSRPISSHRYVFEADVTGLDYTEIYEFKAELTEAIATIETDIITVQVIPVFDWSQSDFNINVPTTINGMAFGENVVLEKNIHTVLNPYDNYSNDWITFDTPLSKLPHGVMIVFGQEDGNVEHFQSFFIPKYCGQIDPENGFLMQFTLFNREGKYQVRGFKVFDDKLEASYIFPTSPVWSGSMLVEGIDAFEIRYVIGV